MPVASVDPMASRMRRTFPAVGAALLALALVTGCAPEPAPTPTPTGFASDDEAFAAAEATYRAYSKALDARRVDPEAMPDPDSFLTGGALQGSIEGEQKLRDAGVHLEGSSSIVGVKHVSADSSSATITVCLDVSGVTVLNSSGANVTPADRPALNALEIEVVSSTPQPLILRSDISDVAKC